MKTSHDISQANMYDYASVHLFSFMAGYNMEVDPQYRFTDKFFMGLCAYYSDFLKDADQRTFLLEAPPRTGKTEFLFNLVIPFFCGNNPNKRIMILTSTKATRRKLQRGLKRVFQSDYFQKVFPSAGKSLFSEERIELANGCYILLTTTLATVPTGDGFHLIAASDYISASMIASPPTMNTAFDNWESYMTRTQSDPKTKVLIDNQRLNYFDLSWKVTQDANRVGEKVTRITLPYQFDDDYDFKLPNGVVIPFKKAEYLVSRFNDREKQSIVARVGTEKFGIQYQQQALMEKGTIFNRGYFRYYDDKTLESTTFIRGFITTDFAFKKNKSADYTVFCYWLMTEKNEIYLGDMFRGKVEGFLLNATLWNFVLKCKERKEGCGVDELLVEKNHNEIFIATLKNGFPIEEGGANVYITDLCYLKEEHRFTNKANRARQTLGSIQGGRVFLPNHKVKIDGVTSTTLDIVEPFLKELEQFTGNEEDYKHDDIVDNLVDAVYHLNTFINYDYSIKV